MPRTARRAPATGLDGSILKYEAAPDQTIDGSTDTVGCGPDRNVVANIAARKNKRRTQQGSRGAGRQGKLGYLPKGAEIWSQNAGNLTAFVHAVTTDQTIHRAIEALWKHDRHIEISAVDPEECAVLSGGRSGPHQIEGIGIGFVPPLWHLDKVDRIERVSTQDAKNMARRLARQLGIFAGTSTGANAVAAPRVAAGPVVDIGCARLRIDTVPRQHRPIRCGHSRSTIDVYESSW